MSASTDAAVAAGSSDAQLIERSAICPEDFALIFDRHAASVHGYLRRRIGNPAADDLLAETFLVAFERRGRYDLAIADARPWLFGIATNLLRRFARAEARAYRALAPDRRRPGGVVHRGRGHRAGCPRRPRPGARCCRSGRQSAGPR